MVKTILKNEGERGLPLLNIKTFKNYGMSRATGRNKIYRETQNVVNDKISNHCG